MIKKASLLFVALCVVSSVSVSVARAEGGDSHDRMMIPPPGMFGGHGNGQDDNEGSDNGPHGFGEHGSSSRPRMHNPNASSTNWNHEEGDGHHGSSTRDHDGSMHNGSSVYQWRNSDTLNSLFSCLKMSLITTANNDCLL